MLNFLQCHEVLRAPGHLLWIKTPSSVVPQPQGALGYPVTCLFPHLYCFFLQFEVQKHMSGDWSNVFSWTCARAGVHSEIQIETFCLAVSKDLGQASGALSPQSFIDFCTIEVIEACIYFLLTMTTPNYQANPGTRWILKWLTMI